MKFAKKSNRGFALILVLLIGALMMVPTLMLLSAAAPRRTSVTGEAVSDIVLASADGVVDKIATKISTFPTVLSSNSDITSQIKSISGNADMARFAIGYLLSSYLNGGDYSAYSDYINHLSDIQKAVSTYLYDMRTQKYYAVWSSNRIKSVGSVGPTGDIAGTSTSIQDLSSNTKVSSAGIGGIDSYWSTDNRWIEIDTNTQFDNTGNDDAHSRFIIRATAYPLSTNKDVSGRMRTIQAEVTAGHIKVSSTSWPPQAFDKALLSGGSLTMNSSGNISGDIAAAGDISLPSGLKLTGNIHAGGYLKSNSYFETSGNMDADNYVDFESGGKVGGYIHSGSDIKLNSTSSLTVGGDIEASGSINLADVPKTITNSPTQTISSYTLKSGDTVSLSTGSSYNPVAIPPIPTFDFGAASTQATTATTGTGSVLPGSYTYCWYPVDPTNVNVGASGSTLGYYIGGNVSYPTSPTLNLTPVSGSTYAWYVGGDVTINGNITLNFTSPGTIYIGGTFHANQVTIIGNGTIIANKVDLHGPLIRPSGDTTSSVAIIVKDSGETDFSNAITLPSIIFAPNGSVKFNSGANISSGSIVAKTGITAPSMTNINFGGDMPPYPGSSSAAVSLIKTNPGLAFKRSWKELISGKYTITPSNIGTYFPVPQVDPDNGHYSS
jgi:cytoskeletal protein CcmA (bactofilin family)